MRLIVVKWVLVLFGHTKILADLAAQDRNCQSKQIKFTYKEKQEYNHYYSGTYHYSDKMLSKSTDILEVTCDINTQRSAVDVLKEIYNEYRYRNSFSGIRIKSSFPVLNPFPSHGQDWDFLWKLTLQKNNISKVIPGFLNKFTKLKDLDLSINNISNLADGTFALSESLQKLNLSENVLTTLGEHSIMGLSKLYILDLSKNKLSSLVHDVFKLFQVLEELYLNDNQLKELYDNVFGVPSSITTLNFANNLLNGVSENQFSRFSKLLSLNIGSNNLANFDFDVLINSDRISLDLSNNKIKYLDNIGYVGSLNLSHNLISKTNFSVPFLELLDLSYNNISKIKSIFFSEMTEIRSLYLQHNHLKNLPNNIFNNMPFLSNLDLSHNYLENLPTDIFKNMSFLSDLDISYNYLDKNSYAHNNSWFNMFVSMTSLKHVILDHNFWRCSNLKDVIHILKTNGANLVSNEMFWGNELNKTNIFGIGCTEDVIVKVNDSTILSINSSIVDDLYNDVKVLENKLKTFESRFTNEIENIKNKQSNQGTDIANKLISQNLSLRVDNLENLFNKTKLTYNLQNKELLSHQQKIMSKYFQNVVENIIKSKIKMLVADFNEKFSQNVSARFNIVSEKLTKSMSQEKHENVSNNSDTFWEIVKGVLLFSILSAFIYLCYLYKKSKMENSPREEIGLI